MSGLQLVESDVNPLSLLQELYAAHQLSAIPNGSGSSHAGGPEGWIYGLELVRLPEKVWNSGLLVKALSEVRRARQVGALRQVMVNRLLPHGKLDVHRDGWPDRLRFHLPLQTNPASYWWDERNGHIHMKSATWYGPVPYCGVLHSAVNGGDTDRVHLVVDFERR